MRIFDLPHQKSASTRRVGVMGSCRVNHPFDRLETASDVLRVWMDNSVVHNASEAHQNLALLRGETPPSVLVPYIAEPPIIVPPLGVGSELLDSVDTFLVEISDQKVIRAGDWCLQVNFLTRHLVQRYPAALFPWYRQLTTVGRADADTVDAAIARLADSGISELRELREILRFARLHRQSHEEVVESIIELVEDSPGRWLFVSHFALEGDHGSLMEDRRKLIGAVRDGARLAKSEFFDPSVLIERHGRTTALAANGADLYEYAAPFNEVVGAAYLALLQDQDPVFATSKSMASKRSKSNGSPFDTVDRELQALHKKRLAAEGTYDSGLYEHYETLLNAGSIFGADDRNRFEFLHRFSEPVDRYVLYRAGLGELGFALALAGKKVTAWEPNDNRRKALQEGFKALSRKYPAIRANFDLVEGPIEDLELPSGETSVGIALNLLIPGEPDDRKTAAAMARHDQLVVVPRLFVRTRDIKDAERETRDLLREAGFKDFEAIPVSGALLARRAEPTEGRQHRLRFVSAVD